MDTLSILAENKYLKEIKVCNSCLKVIDNNYLRLNKYNYIIVNTDEECEYYNDVLHTQIMKCDNCKKSDNTIRNVEDDTNKFKNLCKECILRCL